LTVYLLVGKPPGKHQNSTSKGVRLMQSTEHKSFGVPDEKREFPNGHAEILNVDWFGASNYAK